MKKIFLADDNPDVRSALRLLLEQQPEGYLVIDVDNIERLLVQINDTCPVLFLLDWDIPGLHEKKILELLKVGSHILGYRG